MAYTKLEKGVLHPEHSTSIFETPLVPIHNSPSVIWLLQTYNPYIIRLCICLYFLHGQVGMNML